MKESIWQAETDSSREEYSSDTTTADVIVIGAGMTGLCVAWQLQQQDRDVLVLEAGRIGGGTSGQTTGKITSQHNLIYHPLLERLGKEKAKIYGDANQWAVGALGELVEEQGIACGFENQPAFLYSRKKSDDIDKEYRAARELGLPATLVDLDLSSTKALRFSDQAQFQPAAFLRGLAEKFTAGGGAIAENRRVVKVKEEGEQCIVGTETGEYRARYVVYATLFPILDHTYFALRLRPMLHHGMAFAADSRAYDGMFLGIDDISFRYYKNILIVVGSRHVVGVDTEDPYERLRNRARELFGCEEELSRWSAHDQFSPDGVPFIGTYTPQAERRFVATGFSAWGLTHAMVAARIIGEKMAGKQSPWAEFYTPWRTGKILATAVEKAADGLKSMARGKHLCPHMGCGLVRNEHDDTWDCPCHGSRFAGDGAILWGPALKPMKNTK